MCQVFFRHERSANVLELLGSANHKRGQDPIGGLFAKVLLPTCWLDMFWYDGVGLVAAQWAPSKGHAGNILVMLGFDAC